MVEQPELFIDEELIRELRHPGSDQRCGVNLIARPPAELSGQISAVQNYLKAKEPTQYFYPMNDLHLTFLEFCSGREPLEADRIFEQVRIHLGEALESIQGFVLRPPVVRFDSHAGFLVFENAGGLNEARQTLFNKLAAKGLAPAPRYSTGSTHLTFMRYIAPLTGGMERLADEEAALSTKLSSSWKISSLWLTCGANWYGMKSRIKEAGPFKIRKK